MKKEWVLLITTLIVTLLISIIFIRVFAPQLLGIPPSLQLVQVSKKIPPFYEGVFRMEDFNSREFQLNDPYVEVRSKPLIPEFWGMEVVGPHDILGFRNRYVPNVADIIVIGDSQTYGNNAVFEDNWPSQLTHILGNKKPTVYSMAAGSWGAIQYLDMFDKAILFQPRIVIVAFYTGNDPLDSFILAYNIDKWKPFRTDPNISSKDAPSVKFPPPESEWWHIKFKDGVETTFTPRLRLASNQEHPAVHAGYDIMRDVARQISMKARTLNIQVIFTVVPTKELVYAEKVLHDEFIPPKDYLTLIGAEEKNIKSLVAELAKFPNAMYVDLLVPLQQAALKPIQLYPSDINGHPIAAGYKVMAEALSSVADGYLYDNPQGLFAVELSSKDNFIALINNEGVWVFDRDDIMKANGWPLENIKTIKYRDIANIPIRGIVTTIDPTRFGPISVRPKQYNY